MAPGSWYIYYTYAGKDKITDERGTLTAVTKQHQPDNHDATSSFAAGLPLVLNTTTVVGVVGVVVVVLLLLHARCVVLDGTQGQQQNNAKATTAAAIIPMD